MSYDTLDSKSGSHLPSVSYDTLMTAPLIGGRMTLAVVEATYAPSGRQLPYGAMAIALYASPFDFPAARMSPEALCRCAEMGMRALGGPDRVEALHAKLLELNRRLLRRNLSVSAYEAEMICLLQSEVPGIRPDTARLRWCEGCDFERLRST